MATSCLQVSHETPRVSCLVGHPVHMANCLKGRQPSFFGRAAKVRDEGDPQVEGSGLPASGSRKATASGSDWEAPAAVRQVVT